MKSLLAELNMRYFNSANRYIKYDNKQKKCSFILKSRDSQQNIEDKFVEGFIKKENEYHLELNMQDRFNADLIKDKVLECINRFEQQNKNEE